MRSKTEIGFKGMGFYPPGEISPSWFADSAKGILFIVLAAIGSSAKSIFVRLAYLQQVDAATLLTLRMGISLPLVMLIWGFEDKYTECYKLRITDGSADLVLGLLGYCLANMLELWELELISAGLERLIVFLYPTLVTIFSCIYFGRIMQKMELVALGTCYLGIVMVLYRQIDFSHPEVLLGSALVFGSAPVYAAYLIGSYQLIARVGAYRFTALGMLVACVACRDQFALTHPISALDVSSNVYILSACLARFSTVIPSLFLSLGIERIGPSQAALISSIGPVSSLTLANLFLGEKWLELNKCWGLA